MDLRFTDTEEDFRRELLGFLKQELPSDWNPLSQTSPFSQENFPFTRSMASKLAEKGWLTLAWPQEYGGQGRPHLEQMIYNEEAARARAPNLINLSVGTSLTGPTLIACGAEWQKQRFLEPILDGSEIWCQGFSEPIKGGLDSAITSLRIVSCPNSSPRKPWIRGWATSF